METILDEMVAYVTANPYPNPNPGTGVNPNPSASGVGGAEGQVADSPYMDKALQLAGRLVSKFDQRQKALLEEQRLEVVAPK